MSDSGNPSAEAIINDIRPRTDLPIKYIKFDKDGYSLAEARNRAVIEAQGEILVFCDDRIKMEKNAVEAFVETQTVPKVWQWGIKDNFEKGFVENFSCVNRSDLIQFGMFNERIDRYGGMTQEIRTRFEGVNNFLFEVNKKALANSIRRATSKSRRREDIIKAKFTISKLYD